jgi:HEAT repeat protein
VAAIKDTLHLERGPWGLRRAKEAAARVLTDPKLVQALLRDLFSDNAILRWRAADTARRVTEKHAALLDPHADDLLGLFSESGKDNWRTRAHLGLVVARVAHSRLLRMRTAGLLRPLYYHPSNVVRCTAIEGLGLLAQREPALRPQVEPLLEEALATGTLAMKNRAQHALARLYAKRGT